MRRDEFIEGHVEDYHQIINETTIITKFIRNGTPTTWTHHIKCHRCKTPTLCGRASADPLCRNCFHKSITPMKGYFLDTSSDED